MVPAQVLLGALLLLGVVMLVALALLRVTLLAPAAVRTPFSSVLVVRGSRGVRGARLGNYHLRAPVLHAGQRDGDPIRIHNWSRAEADRGHWRVQNTLRHKSVTCTPVSW